ncbi:uncharacterized protein F5147DRAFT_653150 [Suillus discolor]|uniref:Uncharacterized protein n=1 Tax=Suillus discolor TaxID=1912936 RepID=A0A9P7F762_9AGAM|nr:uncharacterized protein F5147DRAFT_653150 [Suillus discolor]KAG2108070.1 hypothetical protein F5147DRAFT_653150 [Suillus discolor]
MPRSESPIVVPQKKVCLQKAEVLVLRAHLEDWKSVKDKERSRVLLAIYKEASLQAPTKEKALLKARRKIYKQWLQNQSRQRGAAKPLIKYGRHWTARQETGEMAGSEGMITKWLKAAKTVINCLSAEEREEAEAMAERWNNEAAPLDIQAEIAESKGADMIEHFATEMFKKARMQVCILSAWKDSQGKLMLGGHNFNEQFGDGESFIKTRDWDGIIMPEWVEYVGEQFDGEDDGEPQMVKSKKRVAKKLVELDEDADGWPILPDTMGWKRAEQQHMIRSFLTKLYRMCSSEENLKAVVPWGDVIHDPWAFFDGAHWPAGVQLKEPSKMDKADATTVLDFWFARQKDDMQPAFSFKAWKDSDGEMQEADLCPPSAHRGNATKQSKGKGKGKANPKANRCCVPDDSNSEDELDSDLGEDGSRPSSKDEGAPSTGGEPKISPPPKVALPTRKKIKSQPASSRRDTRQPVAKVGGVLNPPTRGSISSGQPLKSQGMTLKAPAASPATGTKSKQVAYTSNEPPKNLKCRGTNADTPAWNEKQTVRRCTLA